MFPLWEGLISVSPSKQQIFRRELIIGRRARGTSWRNCSERARPRRTVDPHLWVIIVHSCVPRDKSEAIRKLGRLSARRFCPTAFICHDPRKLVNRGATWRIAAVRCFQCFVLGGCSPFIGISAHSIMGIIKEMGWVPTAPTRDLEGEGNAGRVCFGRVDKRNSEFTNLCRLFPCCLKMRSERFGTHIYNTYIYICAIQIFVLNWRENSSTPRARLWVFN